MNKQSDRPVSEVCRAWRLNHLDRWIHVYYFPYQHIINLPEVALSTVNENKKKKSEDDYYLPITIIIFNGNLNQVNRVKDAKVN